MSSENRIYIPNTLTSTIVEIWSGQELRNGWALTEWLSGYQAIVYGASDWACQANQLISVSKLELKIDAQNTEYNGSIGILSVLLIAAVADRFVGRATVA